MRSLNSPRKPLIDVMKGLACLFIVGHHLAVYGPMSDAAQTLLPNVMPWLFDYGRMAVQVFLVISGYLMAAQLSQLAQRERRSAITALIQKRYLRLVIPFILALLFGLALSAALHEGLDTPEFETVASWPQWWSHVLLMQTWLHQESIAAGAWYVAIDFQLYALMAAVFCACQTHAARSGPAWMRPEADPQSLVALVVAWVLVLVMASLFYFNLHPSFDVSALYFAGAYGLGMLARWFSKRPQAWIWVFGLAALIGLALLFEFRWRIVVAGLTALLLCAESLLSSGSSSGSGSGPSAGPSFGPFVGVNRGLAALRLMGLGKISYSVFLIHFPICMAFNVVWSQYFADASPWLALAGLCLAVLTSVAMGYLFWRWVESRVPQWLQTSGQWFRALPALR